MELLGTVEKDVQQVTAQAVHGSHPSTAILYTRDRFSEALLKAQRTWPNRIASATLHI